MCLSPPRRGPPPRSSLQQSHAEKDRFRSGSSSGSSTDEASVPSSPNLRKRDSRRHDDPANDDLPPGRVATIRSHPPSSSSFSSARHSASPSTRKNPTRKSSLSVTPKRKNGRGSLNKSGGSISSATASPAVSELNYRLSAKTPKSANSPAVKRSGSVRTSTGTSLKYLTPNPTPGGSPKKRDSVKSYSTTSRLSVAATDATFTSPLLKPGGSSKASSDAGSSRAGSDAGNGKRLNKLSGSQRAIGLGISTGETAAKKAAVPLKRSSSVKAPAPPMVTTAAPTPTIKVHPVPLPTIAPVSEAEIPVSLPPLAAQNSVKPPTQAAKAPQTPTAKPASQPAVIPQRPPIVRKKAYITSPRLVQAPSVSSSSSGCSSSSPSSTDSTNDNLESGSTVGITSSHVYIPEKPPICSVAKLKPVAVQEQITATVIEPRKELPKEPAIRTTVESAALAKKPPDVESHVTSQKQNPRRPSSQASVETVDYAAFVVESRKKKKRQKLKPIVPDMDGSPLLIKAIRRSNSIRSRTAIFSNLQKNLPTAPVASTPVKSKTGILHPEFQGAAAHVHAAFYENGLSLVKVEDSDSGSVSDVSTIKSSVAPFPDPPHRQGQRRILRWIQGSAIKDADKTLGTTKKIETYDSDGSSIASFQMGQEALPEVPVPPPFAPSPPLIPRRGRTRKKEHMPPRGAAESWYPDVAGPREVEQNWLTAGELWEVDPQLPEAPSPPPSCEFTPAEDKSPHEKRRRRKGKRQEPRSTG